MSSVELIENQKEIKETHLNGFWRSKIIFRINVDESFRYFLQKITLTNSSNEFSHTLKSHLNYDALLKTIYILKKYFFIKVIKPFIIIDIIAIFVINQIKRNLRAPFLLVKIIHSKILSLKNRSKLVKEIVLAGFLYDSLSDQFETSKV